MASRKRSGRGAGRSLGSGSSRPTQVGEQIRQFMSELLLQGGIKDPRIQAASMVTVTEVRMTPDLRQARALVSVYPDDDPEVVAEVFRGLQSAAGEIKRAIGRQLHLRYTPELSFLVDDSIAYGAKIEALLREVLPPEPPDEVADVDAQADLPTPEEG